MFEVYVLVPGKKNIFLKVLAMVCFAVGGFCIFASLIGATIFLSIAIVGISLGVFLNSREHEYEYSYFDGDVRFAKILNKSKRKQLRGYTMDDVLLIAPIDDRSAYKYVNDSKIRVRNLNSGQKDANVYVMVAKNEGALEMVKFEPDEKYLDAVCTKYGQKVIRK